MSRAAPRLNNNGFTLVELLVVITIIAILSTIGLTVYGSAQQQARDAKRRSDLSDIKTALELYRNANGKYPVTEWVYSTSSVGTWIPGLDFKYMNKVPRDPKNPSTLCGNPKDRSDCFAYGYYSAGWCSLGGNQYILVARLEAYNKSDLSQQPFLRPNNTLCGYWSGSAVNGLYTIKNP